MIIIGIILSILAICGFIFVIYRFIIEACNHGPNTLEIKDKKKLMKASCEKCYQSFKWIEEDALVKYKYGTKYIVHCPHCNRLTTVNKEER